MVCRVCGLFGNQTEGWVRNYLGFHARVGTLAWVGTGMNDEGRMLNDERNPKTQGRILGCAMIWPVSEVWARFASESIVSGEPDWSADSIYVTQLAAVADGAGVMRSCVRAFCGRFAGIERKKWIAHRSYPDGASRLVRLDGTRYHRWLQGAG